MTTATVPSRPSSSPIAAKMKSVVATGIDVGPPEAEPGALEPAAAERVEALHELVALDLAVGPRVDPGVDALLHVAEDLVRDRRPRRRTAPTPAARYAERSVAM